MLPALIYQINLTSINFKAAGLRGRVSSKQQGNVKVCFFYKKQPAGLNNYKQVFYGYR